MKKLIVTRIWIDGNSLYAETDNGKTASYDLSAFRGFKDAQPSQLMNFEVINGNCIHWSELDEDINLEGMFHDNHFCQLTPTEDSVVYAG